MPNKIDDFAAWKIIWLAYRALQGISQASGYNTTPFVTMDYQKYASSEAKHALWLEATTHSSLDKSVGGTPRFTQQVALVVHANSKIAPTDIARKMSMALEQDTRTALHGTVETFRTMVGRGGSFAFGECPHDGGLLAPNGEAGFMLNVTYDYLQGSEW